MASLDANTRYPARLAAPFAIITALATSTVSQARAVESLQAVALSGDIAAGTSATFSQFSIPAISRGGHVAFSASVLGDGVDPSNNKGVWTYANGTNAALVARSGITPAGSPGETFIEFDAPLINALGQTAFLGYLTGGGVGVWQHGSGALSTVAKRGDDAPGGGGKFEVFHRLLALNASGQLAFRNNFGVSVGGTPTTIFGIWTNTPGAGLELKALEGGAAPEAGPGVVFGGPAPLASPVLNDSGHVAFYGYLAGNGVDHTNDEGIWLENTTGLELVVREGQLAPGTPPGVRFGGRTYVHIPTPAINASGDVAFLGTVIGPGVSSGNLEGIWSRTGGSLRLVARAGSPAPGTDRNFLQFAEEPLINAHGQTAFFGFLTGAATDIRSGVWSEGRGNGLELVAWGGDPAPDTDASFQYIDRFSISLNARGQTAFIGALDGPNVNSSNDRAVFAQDLAGSLRKIVREGDLIDVDAGPGLDLRQVASFAFQGNSGNSDGRRSGFSDRGQLTFSAVFTDGSQGVFISNFVVPEPVAVALAIGGFSVVLPASRRKRNSRLAPESRRQPPRVIRTAPVTRSAGQSSITS